VTVPVYSERLFLKTNTTAWNYWTVPAGFRAVITDAALVGNGTSNCDFYGTIGGVYVLFVVVPGTNPSYFFKTRQVAYAGETIGVKMGVTNCHMAVSGYVFRDVTLLKSGPFEWTEGPPPAGLDPMDPLPASTPRYAAAP
jgi:hypothetical protein